MVVLDTCAIIELCKEAPNFSAHIEKKIYAGCYILSVSFAEIAYKVKTKKLQMNISPEELHTNFSTTANIEILKIGVEEWFDAIQLQWDKNKDPADRLIAAFALKKEIPIISKDNHIKRFYKNTLW
jgi:PIN domain nuclease of toxin-antitoxin system